MSFPNIYDKLYAKVDRLAGRMDFVQKNVQKRREKNSNVQGPIKVGDFSYQNPQMQKKLLFLARQLCNPYIYFTYMYFQALNLPFLIIRSVMEIREPCPR